jgi:hypothetical protein
VQIWLNHSNQDSRFVSLFQNGNFNVLDLDFVAGTVFNFVDFSRNYYSCVFFQYVFCHLESTFK